MTDEPYAQRVQIRTHSTNRSHRRHFYRRESQPNRFCFLPLRLRFSLVCNAAPRGNINQTFAVSWKMNKSDISTSHPPSSPQYNNKHVCFATSTEKWLAGFSNEVYRAGRPGPSKRRTDTAVLTRRFCTEQATTTVRNNHNFNDFRSSSPTQVRTSANPLASRHPFLHHNKCRKRKHHNFSVPLRATAMSFLPQNVW